MSGELPWMLGVVRSMHVAMATPPVVLREFTPEQVAAFKAELDELLTGASRRWQLPLLSGDQASPYVAPWWSDPLPASGQAQVVTGGPIGRSEES